MVDNVLVAMGSFGIGYVLNVEETETTFLSPVNVAFTQKKFYNEVKSILSLICITSCRP